MYLKGQDGQERRVHSSAVLGLKASMRKWEAGKELARIIERETGASPTGHSDSRVTLGWFVRERYLPMREGSWRASIRTTNLGILKNQILPAFEDQRLCDIDKFLLQTHLNSLAKKFSHSIVDHVRNFLKSILEEAVDLEFIDKNPARKLANPETRKLSIKRVLTFEQLNSLLGKLSERDRLIVGIASVCALRPGELFALKRKCFQGVSSII